MMKSYYKQKKTTRASDAVKPSPSSKSIKKKSPAVAQPITPRHDGRRGGDERADAEGVRHEHGVRTLHRDDEIGSVGACSSSGVESFG
ncbi:hypothetical protein LINGRAPRIM_LOCUS3170 [Linum grandiflorum]